MSCLISMFFISFKRSWILDTEFEVGAGSDDWREGGDAGVVIVEGNKVDGKGTGGGGRGSKGKGCGSEWRGSVVVDAHPLLTLSLLISSRTAHSHSHRLQP
jgi:hypothetical protein